MQRLHDLKIAWSVVEKELRFLASRRVDKAWFGAWSDAMAQFNDLQVHGFWTFDRNVNDAEGKKMMEFVNSVVGPLGNKLYHALVMKSAEWRAVEPRFVRIVAMHRNEAKLASDDVFELEKQEGALTQRYYETVGELTVALEGEFLTLAEASNRRRHETNRERREALWRQQKSVVAGIDTTVDELFLQLVEVRQAQAQTLGFESYLDYAWAKKNERSYTPSDALQVVQDVEEVFVPMQRRAAAYLRTKLNVPRLRPWDFVPWSDKSSRSDYDEAAYRDAIIQAYTTISPAYGQQVSDMAARGHMDLMARQYKSSLNYSSVFCCSNQALVFCNGTGALASLRVMLHETGHAIHEERTGANKLMFERVAPLEIREFVAYCFQFLAVDALCNQGTLNTEEARVLNLFVAETILEIFDLTIASERFQHWVYEVPRELNADMLDRQWLSLTKHHPGDWEGLEAHLRKGWQDAHTVTMPFYNFEYIVAYLGMLQFIKLYRANPDQAHKGLNQVLSYGNTRSLVESFEGVGISFPFSKRDIELSREVFIDEFIRDVF